MASVANARGAKRCVSLFSSRSKTTGVPDCTAVAGMAGKGPSSNQLTCTECTSGQELQSSSCRSRQWGCFQVDTRTVTVPLSEAGPSMAHDRALRATLKAHATP
eukprot:4520211-Prymnesium_polylepis.1